MAREGYDPGFTAALIASASTMANLIPPSIMAVVYGATGNVSIGGLFLGGVVPGVLVGLGLMIYSYFFGPVGFMKPRASLFATGRRGEGCRSTAGDPGHHHGWHPDRAGSPRRRRASSRSFTSSRSQSRCSTDATSARCRSTSPRPGSSTRSR